MTSLRQIHIGNVAVGGGAPVSVQSMTNTDTRDAEATLSQIRSLAAYGCEIVRVAVPDEAAVEALARITAESPLAGGRRHPFQGRSWPSPPSAPGAAGLRINPGNIGSRERVRGCHRGCARGRHPGAHRRQRRARCPRKSASWPNNEPVRALVETILDYVTMFEDLDFREFQGLGQILFGDARPSRPTWRWPQQIDYPIHLGVTEAGTRWAGSIKSAVGIGALLAQGVGDTIRVSLTGDPVEEVRVGYEILRSLGLREHGPNLISCPTCGRTEIDVEAIALEVERRLADYESVHSRSPSWAAWSTAPERPAAPISASPAARERA